MAKIDWVLIAFVSRKKFFSALNELHVLFDRMLIAINRHIVGLFVALFMVCSSAL